MNKELSLEEKKIFLEILKARFEKNKTRHPNIEWKNVENKLIALPKKLSTLFLMEQSGGEPDVVVFDSTTNEYVFYDCSVESPSGRRSFCYDREALDKRKANKPKDNAVESANEMGIELLNEEEYRTLQSLGDFDTKTSSWLKTPDNIRKLGGAIFGDYRFGTVFVYHNGAESYYAGRGFRGWLKV